MQLQILLKNNFKIAAVSQNNQCEVETFLEQIDARYSASADGIFSLIEHISENGLNCLSSKLCHLIDRDNKIYELIKGDIRLLFFRGHGDILIIASHAFIKKSQKTPNKEKSKAINYKKQYQKAHDQQKLDVIDE